MRVPKSPAANQVKHTNEDDTHTHQSTDASSVSGSNTIDAHDPVGEYVLSGGLAESATAGGLDVTIAAVALNGAVLDAAMMAAFLASYNLTEDQTFTYAVTGDSITVSGDLITELTGETSITATRS